MDSPDVAQEVLAETVRQITSRGFRGDASLATWVHAVAKRRVADYFRKAGRHVNTVSLEEVSDADRHFLTASRREQIVAVEEALGRLSTAERLVLVLCEREGYTLIEIGRMLGLGKSAVWERLHAARRQFRNALEATGKMDWAKRLKD
jgi:RNA polymerase sigma factor (sigma-70 family)